MREHRCCSWGRPLRPHGAAEEMADIVADKVITDPGTAAGISEPITPALDGATIVLDDMVSFGFCFFIRSVKNLLRFSCSCFRLINDTGQNNPFVVDFQFKLVTVRVSRVREVEHTLGQSYVTFEVDLRSFQVADVQPWDFVKLPILVDELEDVLPERLFRDNTQCGLYLVSVFAVFNHLPKQFCIELRLEMLLTGFLLCHDRTSWLMR